MLRGVVCALSAMHYYRNISGESRVKIAAFEYYGSAVKELQSILRDLDKHDWHSRLEASQAEDLLLAVTWFCVYEVACGGSTNWRSHLKALSNLIVHSDIGYAVDPEVMRFVGSM
jgi:hypothetical protein